ncbi:MAG: DUF2235 domain-containing protein [Novosphingobium sp.]
MGEYPNSGDAPDGRAGEPTADGPSRTRTKRILLFSDGTGNSSARIFRTNVWRMYQAVDLGPTQPDQVVQIGFYGNGVGTSNFRPLAALGGIFGFGLKRNVVELYEFLCRNYQVGDEIFVFGFSRGAFTIRLLVELICTQGIVRYDDPSGPLQSEAQLQRQSREAFRRMHAGWRLNNPVADAGRKLVLRLVAALRRAWLALRGIDAEPVVWDIPGGVAIEFVGLWDTVAAYGGPIVEITRAVDDWIWPLTMPDFELSRRVRCARHALALDDARDSFQPMLWDETRESPPEPGQAPRLKQVWFTGMHADVGGGYPDDSLSYVSLTWMIEEIGPRLRLLDDAVRQAYDLANDFGPMHDSRAGVGSYYRYQPRRIAALLDPPTDYTIGMRDPNVWASGRGGDRRRHGLIRTPLIHESVFRRIIDGTDGYGPVSLPRQVEMVRRDPAGRHAELLPRLPSQLPRDLAHLAGEARGVGPHAPGAAVWDKLDLVWSTVWYRRAAYFATVIPSFLLVTMFLWERSVPWLSGLPICNDDRCALPGPITALKSLAPEVAGAMIDGWAKHPGWFLGLAAFVVVMLWIGHKLEGRIQYQARTVWADATRRITEATAGGQVEADPGQTATRPPPVLPVGTIGAFGRFRNGRFYQSVQQRVKWTLAPLLLGPVLIGAILFASLWIVAQARILVNEERARLCATPARAADAPVLATSSLCFATGVAVKRGETFRIVLAQTSPWEDRGPVGDPVAASLSGVAPDREPLPLKLSVLYKRVTTARYLQPVALVRPNARGRGVLVAKLAPSPVTDKCVAAPFTAAADGALYLFVNDAVPPVGPVDLFYRDNRGEARVRVLRVTRGATMAAVDAAVAVACTRPDGTVSATR